MDSSVHVLVVDDDRLLVRIISSILERQGCRVTTASDGQEGLAKTQALLPDLIILDLMMPKMDGIEVCRRVKGDAETAHIPVLLFSALGKRELEQQNLDVYALGADDYITKPVKVQELLSHTMALLTASGVTMLQSA